MNVKKTEAKIQVLLDSNTMNKLKSLIAATSFHRRELITISAYVRELIESHVQNYQGEQTSFVNEHVRKIFEEYYKNKKNE